MSNLLPRCVFVIRMLLYVLFIAMVFREAGLFTASAITGLTVGSELDRLYDKKHLKLHDMINTALLKLTEKVMR